MTVKSARRFACTAATPSRRRRAGAGWEHSSARCSDGPKPFDYATFRAEFIRLKRMTSYERALDKAETARAEHDARMAGQVRDHARRHPTHFRRANGKINWRRVERRAAPDWWQDARLWHSGPPRLASVPVQRDVTLHGQMQAFTEEAAFENIRAWLRGDADPPVIDEETFRALVRAVLAEEQR